MELIGKKVVRKTAFEASNEPKVIITLKKATARLGFTGAAMRKINLFSKEVGIAYDDSKAYVYITPEGEGNKVKDNGSCNSRYHAQRLITEFNLEAEGGELVINTIPELFDECPGIKFYEVSKPLAISAETLKVESEEITSELAISLDDLNTESSYPENNVVDQDSLEQRQTTNFN